MENKNLYTVDDCLKLEMKEVKELYSNYVNKSQVDILGSFGFGRVLSTHAEGMYIHTNDKRKILDFTGGIGVLNHGHNHPRILKARIKFQEERRLEVHKSFLSPYLSALSHNIAQVLPEDLDISYLCNSGSEAVEGAVKLAYKYHQGKRDCILNSDISFHGKLLGTGGLTCSPELNFKFPTIPNRHSFKYNNIESVKALIEKLRKKNGESNIYAILIEPFNASSLRECSLTFLQELRLLCDLEKIVLIFDEVYTGWGKTGALFNFMKKRVIPDVVTMAKSTGGGKSSISCFTTRKTFFKKAYDNLSDAMLHSTTYNGFGEECVTALEAINIAVEDNYVEKAQNIFKVLNPGLKGLQKKYPDLIKEVRGSGALNGIILNPEISPVIKAALKFMPVDLFKDPRFMAKLFTSSVISELFNNHRILTFLGQNKEIPLVISPSLIVKEEEIRNFLKALDETLSLGKYSLIIKFAKFRFLKDQIIMGKDKSDSVEQRIQN